MNYKPLKVGDKVTYRGVSFFLDISHRGKIKSFEENSGFCIVTWNTRCYQGDARECTHELMKVD